MLSSNSRSFSGRMYLAPAKELGIGTPYLKNQWLPSLPAWLYYSQVMTGLLKGKEVHFQKAING
eukprot:6047969-Amphidinium_carterae.1